MGEALAVMLLFALLANMDRPVVVAFQMFAVLVVLALAALVASGAIHIAAAP